MMTMYQTYMVLLCFMIHRYCSHVFSCTEKWTTYVNGLQSRYTYLMRLPYALFHDTLSPWPPDGYIMVVVAFFGLLFFYITVLTVRSLQVLSFWVRKGFWNICHGAIVPLPYNFRGIKLGESIKKNEPLFTRQIYLSVCLSADDRESIDDVMSFDTYLDRCINDNLANAHIWPIKRDFIPKTLVQVQKSDFSRVATIGSVDLSPHSMGDIKTSWKDNNRRMRECILKWTLYFPGSPVNIISFTALIE